MVNSTHTRDRRYGSRSVIDQRPIVRDYAGEGATRCLAPWHLPMQVAYGSFTEYEVFTGKQVPHSVTGEPLDVSWTERVGTVRTYQALVRCRVCPNCTALNSYIWAEAAKAFHDEIVEDGGETVAVTLTFSDFKFREWWELDRERRALDYEACDLPDAALAARDEPLPRRFFPNNREHLRVAIAGLKRELTLYNKRLNEHAARKPGILPIRHAWMSALEFGTKKGRPHLHAIYHLKGDVNKCRLFRRHAKRDWSSRIGFTKVKPVRSYAGCSYASKYIGKTYDAGYLAFYEALRDRPKGPYGSPIISDAEAVERARILGVAKLQRTRTRSSLGYRARGVKDRPPTEHNEIDEIPFPDETGATARPHSDYQRDDGWCRECGSLDGCDCEASHRSRADGGELDHFRSRVEAPPTMEDERRCTSH